MDKEEFEKVVQELQEDIKECEQEHLLISKGFQALDNMIVRMYLQQLCFISERTKDNEQCAQCEFAQVLALMLDQSITKKIERSIKKALETLEYELIYDLDSHYSNSCLTGGITYYFKIQFKEDYFFHVPPKWRVDIEVVLTKLLEDFHGCTRWEDNTFIIAIEKRYDT